MSIQSLQCFQTELYHLAGEGVSTYDLMDTVKADMVKVNLLAVYNEVNSSASDSGVDY